MLAELAEFEDFLSSSSQLSDDLHPTSIQEAWRYFVQEDHLPTWKEEAVKDLFLLFVSAGSALYGIIANRFAADRPEWERQLFIYGTAVPAAAVLINATNEYFLRRNARRFPEELKQYYLPTSKIHFFIEDIAVGCVSAIASIAFATAAWRYSDGWGDPSLQIAWTVYIEFVNTALHLLPVELVIFNHPVFSLPIKPFRVGLQWLYRLSIPREEKAHRDFLAFKCKIVDKISEKFKENIDQSMRKILQGSFQWNGFSGEIKKWISFIKKPGDQLNHLHSMPIHQFLEQKTAPVPETKSREVGSSRMIWMGQKLKNLSYGIGAVWLLSSCAGFLADPFGTLADSDMNENAAFTISGLASYFLGVLLGHMGGSSLQSDLTKIYHIIRGQGEIPLHAKLHTKSFGLWLLISLLLARYSYAMSVELIDDHFSDFSFCSALKAISISGVTYMSFFAMQKLFEDYIIKLTRLNFHDENRTLAVLQQKIENFKRHIPSDPDQFLKFFSQMPEEDMQSMLGLSKNEFTSLTDFETSYREYLEAQSKLCSSKTKSYCRWLVFGSKNASNQELLLNTYSQSPSSDG